MPCWIGPVTIGFGTVGLSTSTRDPAGFAPGAAFAAVSEPRSTAPIARAVAARQPATRPMTPMSAPVVGGSRVCTGLRRRGRVPCWLEQGVRERPASREHARVLRVERVEQSEQMYAHGVTLVATRAPDEI